MLRVLAALCIAVLATIGIQAADVVAAADAAASVAPKPAYTDPVPHNLITQPYRVCQDLEELTSRIDNLYRKPYAKLNHNAIAQNETVYFKDIITGHEIACLTRELCVDVGHGDLQRPVWSMDGSKILFMGNRGFYKPTGEFQKGDWGGWKFEMAADYSNQRPLVATILDKDGKPALNPDGTARREQMGVPEKYNTFDSIDPRYVYYGIKDTLWRVCLATEPGGENTAQPICTFCNAQRKLIQEISDDHRLLIQDINADPDKKTKVLPYMPEIHLIDLNKKTDENGFYYHHPADYGLEEVRDGGGKVVHDAKNNYQFHSLKFGPRNTINWNYGSMTEVGEYVGWTLDISKGLDGTPTHSDVSGGATVNKWGQYESHGAFVHGSSFNLYFSGPIKNNGKEEGGWGVWLNNAATPDAPPKFLFVAPGGHVVANSCNPAIWAAHVGAQWREKNVKESDAIVFGDTSGNYQVLCYTYSDVRGGISTDRKTKVQSWTGMNNNDARPYSSIPRPLLSRDGTKVMYHSSMLNPLDTWAGMYVAAIRRPEAPRNLKLADANGVQLKWDAATNAHEIKGYHVYRGDRDGHNAVELTDRAIKELSFTDATAQDGQTYDYAVTSEEWSTLESDVTSEALSVSIENGKASAQPAAAMKSFDTTPPAAPRGFAIVKENDESGQFRLSWQANTEKDLRYYNIYFSSKSQPEAIQKRRIVSPLAKQTTYLDWSAPADSDVYYAITAVDRQGNESAPAYAELKK